MPRASFLLSDSRHFSEVVLGILLIVCGKLR